MSALLERFGRGFGEGQAEFSFARGGGEGSQFYATGNTNNAIGFGARAAGTVGLRGVF
jgi:hypothetical protein